MVSIDGDSEVSVIQHPADDGLLGWAPDGRTLLFWSYRRGSGYDAWLVQIIDGKPQGLPQLVKKNTGWIGQFTRDGSFYYERGRQTQRVEDIHIATLDPKNSKLLAAPKSLKGQTAQQVLFPPDFSPDGKYLAYYVAPPVELSSEGPRNPPGNIVIRSLNTGEERELAISPRFSVGVYRRLRWSPDGRFALVFGTDETGRRGIHRVDTDTGKLTAVVLDVPETPHRKLPSGDYVSTAEWSPDGKAIFYSRYHFDLNAPRQRWHTQYRISNSRSGIRS